MNWITRVSAKMRWFWHQLRTIYHKTNDVEKFFQGNEKTLLETNWGRVWMPNGSVCMKYDFSCMVIHDSVTRSRTSYCHVIEWLTEISNNCDSMAAQTANTANKWTVILRQIAVTKSCGENSNQVDSRGRANSWWFMEKCKRERLF